MKKSILYFLLIAIGCVGIVVPTQTVEAASPTTRTLTARSTTAPDFFNTFVGFYESLPRGYDDDPSREWPVLIFLHGIGERGNGTTELSRILSPGPLEHINNGEQLEFTVNGATESFIVLAPQLASSSENWHPRIIEALLDYAEDQYRIDSDRVYLTGLSLGAFATWDFVIFSSENAERIAAITPTDGGGGQGASYWDPILGSITRDFCNVSDAGIAVWQFYGLSDSSWGWSVTGAINGLNACDPDPEPIVTGYSGVGHGAWGRAYTINHTYHNPNMYEWLLVQSRSGSTPPPSNNSPTANAGADKSITLPTSSVTLAGSGTDSDGTIASYAWTKVSGGAATIATAATATTEITGLAEGSYVFRLTVTDDDSATATDEVQVTVNPAASSGGGSGGSGGSSGGGSSGRGGGGSSGSGGSSSGGGGTTTPSVPRPAPSTSPTVPAVPATPAPVVQNRIAVSVQTALRVRLAPNGSVISFVQNGAQGAVLDRQVLAGAPWIKVRFDSGLEGWVSGAYTLPLTAPALSTTTPVTDRVQVRASKLNVRAAPGGTIIGLVPFGTIGTPIPNTTVGSWTKVQFPAGLTGYVSTLYIKNV